MQKILNEKNSLNPTILMRSGTDAAAVVHVGRSQILIAKDVKVRWVCPSSASYKIKFSLVYSSGSTCFLFCGIRSSIELFFNGRGRK